MKNKILFVFFLFISNFYIFCNVDDSYNYIKNIYNVFKAKFSKDGKKIYFVLSTEKIEKLYSLSKEENKDLIFDPTVFFESSYKITSISIENFFISEENNIILFIKFFFVNEKNVIKSMYNVFILDSNNKILKRKEIKDFPILLYQSNVNRDFFIEANDYLENIKIYDIMSFENKFDISYKNIDNEHMPIFNIGRNKNETILLYNLNDKIVMKFYDFDKQMVNEYINIKESQYKKNKLHFYNINEIFITPNCNYVILLNYICGIRIIDLNKKEMYELYYEKNENLGTSIFLLDISWNSENILYSIKGKIYLFSFKNLKDLSCFKFE